MGRGGVRPGQGRKPGSKNKKTIEREKMEAEKAAAALAAVDLKRHRGQRLAVEVLEDMMTLFYGLVARHQPWPKEQGKNPHEDIRLFKEYSKLATTTAAELAQYQQPKFRAVMVAMSPGMPMPGAEGAVVPATPLPPPGASEGQGGAPAEDSRKVVAIDDVATLTRIYQSRMARFG